MKFIPRASVAVALPLEDLALRLLRYLLELEQSGVRVFRSDLSTPGVWGASTGHEVDSDEDEFRRAMLEAWDWLVAHSLLSYGENWTNGGAFITRRGRDTAQTAYRALAELQARELLALELNPILEWRVRPLFTQGRFTTAVFEAMKVVEEQVRASAGVGDEWTGVALMAEAFRPEAPLADDRLPRAEQEGVMALFRGAIGVFKNPNSHRVVNYGDPILAAEIVLLADLLLRLLSQTRARLGWQSFPPPSSPLHEPNRPSAERQDQ